MQKTILLLLSILFSFTGFSSNENSYESIVKMDIWLQVKAIDPSSLKTEIPHAPMSPIKIGVSGHTLYLYGQFDELQLEVKDGDDVIYDLTVASGTESVTLPESMTGDYTLEMSDARYIYSCEIAFE